MDRGLALQTEQAFVKSWSACSREGRLAARVVPVQQFGSCSRECGLTRAQPDAPVHGFNLAVHRRGAPLSSNVNRRIELNSPTKLIQGFA